MPAIPQTHRHHIPSDVLFHIISILAHPGPGPGGDCPPPTTTFQSDPLHPIELLRTISQVCAAWRAEGTSPVLWGRVVDLGYLWGGDTTAWDEELDANDEGESITRRRRKERLREEVIKLCPTELSNYFRQLASIAGHAAGHLMPNISEIAFVVQDKY
ncbi:hypothetical protein CPC08DRAFT_769357 [Agrocybe pediades]|nr:hypothetical protein CPC08DRAFT_769357 [Agrocybe pediades]